VAPAKPSALVRRGSDLRAGEGGAADGTADGAAEEEEEETLSASASFSSSAAGCASKRRNSAFILRAPETPAAHERHMTRAHELQEAEDEGAVKFGPDSVGTYSCHGTEEGAEEGIVAKINQDCACMLHPFTDPGTALWCVYDGHGTEGHTVSQEAMHSMYFELELNENLAADPALALEEAFEATQDHLHLMLLQDEVKVNARDSGACALVAYLQGGDLWVAGAGDCRALLGQRSSVEGSPLPTPVRLSNDHNVEVEEEKARIEGNGGWVMPMRLEEGEEVPARSYKRKGKPWLGPGLRISRALGDTQAEDDGLILPKPDVVHHVVGPDDLFLILASDGVWEFIDDQLAVNIINYAREKDVDATQACKMLIMQSAIMWRKHEGVYRDDITAYVIYLQPVVAGLLGEQTGDGSAVQSSLTSPAAPPSVAQQEVIADKADGGGEQARVDAPLESPAKAPP